MALGDKHVTFDMAKALQEDIQDKLDSGLTDVMSALTPYREDTMTATRSYSAGDLLTVGTKLYRVKVLAISSGQTLSDSNVDEITLRAYLSGSGLASGTNSRAEGSGSTATAEAAHAEGIRSEATGDGAHAEGYTSTASGAYAHAEGYHTRVFGDYAHAEGYNSRASGENAHAEGKETIASGQNAHAEGYGSMADGNNSHAEGVSSCQGESAHSEGSSSSGGLYAHSEGLGTFASRRSQHVFGEYNVSDPSSVTSTNRGTYVEVVGNGTSDSNRSNARTLDWSGNEALQGDLTINTGSQNQVTVGVELGNLKSASIATSTNVTWYAGGISGTAGTENDNSARIKTGFLDRYIVAAVPINGYKVAAVAWNASGAFQGAWNGTAFVDTGLVFTTSALNLSGIDAGYSVRIIAGKTSDGNVSASDGANILLAYNASAVSESAELSELKLSDMVTAHINLLQHITPRSGYYYDGMTQTANSDYVAYPYLLLKAGVTYYYKNLYGALCSYKDLSTNELTALSSGWNGSITPTHDSIFAITSTPTASATALLTTSQDMYNANERSSIYYPSLLYVEKNYEANNLIPALSGNMIEGANYFEGTWVNASSWTTDTAKYKGLTVKKRTGTWSGLNKGITVEVGKHYHFSAYYKVSSAASVQISLTQSDSTATVGFYDDNGVSVVQSLTIPNTVQRADVWRKVNIEFDCTSAGTIHPVIQAVASTTLYVCGYFVGEGYDTTKPFFTCKKSGAADFYALYEAVVFASMFFDATVYVDSGEWDVVDEMGSSYMAAVDSAKRGLYLKNRIHLVFASDSSVVAMYEGEREDTMLWFSPFNASLHGFTLENANIQAENVRYCVHDERNQNADQYTNRYINCKMKLDNSDNTGTTTCQCIGGGLGLNGHIIIQGGDYEGINTAHIPTTGYVPISYHNSAGSGKSRIDISDVYIHSGTVRLNYYGSSTDITECYISGCSFTHAIISGAETEESTNENISVTAWNNEIRT